MALTEDGRVLLDRVVDRSWRHRQTPTSPPPEYEVAIYSLDGAVQMALGADWSPDEIRREVNDLLRAMTETEVCRDDG